MKRGRRNWAEKTLVVGPAEPVDGDSVASTKALLTHLRSLGKEAYTLPTRTMYRQLGWIITATDLLPAILPMVSPELTAPDLQAVYDALLAHWQPDEIVLVDGHPEIMGFDPAAVPIYTIDHHLDHGARDDKQAYIQEAPATGCLLIRRFKILDPILVVAILTDTFFLRQNFPADAIQDLHTLYREGGLSNEVLIDYQRKLMAPRSPEVIVALRSAEMRSQGDAVFCVLNGESRPEIHRDVLGLFGYYYAHICVVRGDGYVSFRTSDLSKCLRPLATKYGGGGHPLMAAGRLESMEPALIDQLYEDFLKEVL